MTTRETAEVKALYDGLTRILDIEDAENGKVGDCQCGIYLFYDYDGEPIYVGRTMESLRTRVRRHLTGQRTDAVAKSVLDPFEVAEIELWPFWDLTKTDRPTKSTLAKAEFTVYQQALEGYALNIILNEGAIAPTDLIDLPASVRSSILPAGERQSRKHPDVRLARRALIIANLSRMISERRVNVGIRRTLWAQAQRLERLAKTRLENFQD